MDRLKLVLNQARRLSYSTGRAGSRVLEKVHLYAIERDAASSEVARPQRKVHSDQIKLVDRVFSLKNVPAINVRLSQRLSRANLPWLKLGQISMG
jgi:hypothetical protein